MDDFDDYAEQMGEADAAFREDVLAATNWHQATTTSATLTPQQVAEAPEFWSAIASIDNLGTSGGWAVLRHRLQQGGHPALEEQPPPQVEWRYVGGAVEYEDERGAPIEVPIDALLVTVSLRRLPAAEQLDWLVERRHVLTELVRQQLRDVEVKVDAMRVVWRFTTRPEEPASVWLEQSSQVAAALRLMVEEAQERVWFSVPWWRTDSPVAASVLQAVEEASDRGVDCRVVTRSPDQRNTYNPDLQWDVVTRLHQAGVQVMFHGQSHQKTYIVDDTLLASSSNLTRSDTWLDNTGSLMFDQDASVQAIRHFARTWSDMKQLAGIVGRSQ